MSVSVRLSKVRFGQIMLGKVRLVRVGFFFSFFTAKNPRAILILPDNRIITGEQIPDTGYYLEGKNGYRLLSGGQKRIPDINCIAVLPSKKNVYTNFISQYLGCVHFKCSD